MLRIGHLSAPALAIMLLTLAACGSSESALLTIRNASSEGIATITVNVCGQSLVAGEVPPSGARDLEFVIHPECDYDAHVTFQSGRKIEGRDGYVTIGGYTTHDYLTVFSDHVEATSEPKTH